MSANPEHDPEFNPAPRKARSGPGCTLVEFLVGLGILAVLIALFLPATRSAREAARRAQCVNNLKEIALALHNYQTDYGVLPPACTVDANGRPLHSWRTLILPYLHLNALYGMIDLSKPWNDPANAKAGRMQVAVFHCPSSAGSPSTTTYLAVVGPDACFRATQSRGLTEITDSRNSTLMIIEAAEEDAVPWMAPLDADESLVLKLGPDSKLHHSGGVNAAFADGSVRFLKATTPAAVRRAMISISGNDDGLTKAW